MPAFVGHHGRTVGLVTMLTILVSVFGYLRDASLAARFGVSATMDAYFGAIFVPSNLYLILVVGTLSPVFIPILLQEDASDDRSRVSETFSVVMNFILLVMIAAVTCGVVTDRKSTRLNSSHTVISYAVFCLKKKKLEQRRFGRAGAVWHEASLRHTIG